MQYKIEKGIPLVRQSKYSIVDHMEEGDSIVFESRITMRTACIRAQKKFPNRRYATRTDAKGQLRLFRTV